MADICRGKTSLMLPLPKKLSTSIAVPVKASLKRTRINY